MALAYASDEWEDSLSSMEVCAFAGIRYRWLDHWRRVGLLRALNAGGGEGIYLRWSRQQAVAARLVRMLARNGVNFGTKLMVDAVALVNAVALETLAASVLFIDGDGARLIPLSEVAELIDAGIIKDHTSLVLGARLVA